MPAWNWRTGFFGGGVAKPGYYRARAIGKYRGRRKRPSSYPRIGRRLTPELKYKNNVLSETMAVASGATFHALNLLTQGDSQSERIGMRFTVRSIEVNLQLAMAQGTTSANSLTVRVILFMDTQANGALTLVNDLLENTDNTQSMYNIEERHRFKIFKDFQVALSAPGLGWDGTSTRSSAMKKVVKFKKRCQIPIFYGAAASTITGVTQNNIQLLVFASATAPASTYAGVVQLRYTDL